MFSFKRNVGTSDRVMRMIIGGLLILLGPITNTFGSITVSVLLSVAGGMIIASALFAYCGLYTLAGFCTYQEPDH